METSLGHFLETLFHGSLQKVELSEGGQFSETFWLDKSLLIFNGKFNKNYVYPEEKGDAGSERIGLPEGQRTQVRSCSGGSILLDMPPPFSYI